MSPRSFVFVPSFLVLGLAFATGCTTTSAAGPTTTAAPVATPAAAPAPVGTIEERARAITEPHREVADNTIHDVNAYGEQLTDLQYDRTEDGDSVEKEVDFAALDAFDAELAGVRKQLDEAEAAVVAPCEAILAEVEQTKPRTEESIEAGLECARTVHRLLLTSEGLRQVEGWSLGARYEAMEKRGATPNQLAPLRAMSTEIEKTQHTRRQLVERWSWRESDFEQASNEGVGNERGDADPSEE